MSCIRDQCHNELDSVFANTEAECSKDFADDCRSIWLRDQENNESGAHGNRFSVLTYRMCLAVYSRSRSAYSALKKFPVLALPSERQLKRMMSSSFAAGQGPSQEDMEQQMRFYEEQQQGKQNPGKAQGAIIFDECKVVGKICWNSKSKEIYGTAASVDTFTSLFDIFTDQSITHGGQPAEYVLQFVWRDLTSNFDILGPFWMAPQSVTTQFLYSCFSEALRLFHAFNFDVICTVCDGASSNLSLMKILTGAPAGPFGVGKSNPDPNDEFSVPASFPHLFDPGKTIFIVICPTHMLKNLINGIYASAERRSKRFQLKQTSTWFGWSSIEKLWQREVSRRATGSERVLGLLHSYIVRDPWTKLNVKPASIMQQDNVIAELKEFADSTRDQTEKEKTLAIVAYLTACNLLFENGFLSHTRVTSLASQPVVNINSGMEFVKNWYRDLLSGGDFLPTNQKKEKRFLAWQTFDLLRLSVYGFNGMVEYYSRAFPSNYLIPHRINGSAVETVFSQIRQKVSGPLTSLNYASGAQRTKTTATVDYARKRNHESIQAMQYRDDNLYFAQKSKRLKQV